MRNFTKAILCLALPIFPTMCVPLPVPAQSDTQMRRIVFLSGASSEEDLDEQEVERYLHLLSHPLEINLAGRSKLIASGLFSRYQVASLEDYRSRSGDILSFPELAAVDGFDPDFVAALRPFISLRSVSLPGHPPDSVFRIRQEALLKMASRDGEYNYGAKYRAGLGGMAEVSLAGRTTYGDGMAFPPSSWSAGVAFNGGKKLGKVVIGDYNLRFGQGLALWSGLALSGFSSSSSFYRRPTGITPSYSWTGIGTHRGAAADFQFGRLALSAFMSFPGLKNKMEGSRKAVVGLMPGASLGWYGRNAQASVTAYCRSYDLGGGEKSTGKVSGDFRWNFRGVDSFGEVVWDAAGGGVAASGGAVVPLGEGWKMSGVARYYPALFDSEFSGGVRSWTKTSDERGVALGLERYGAQLTADLASKERDRSRRQAKIFMKIPLQLTGTTVLTLRATERYRPYEEVLKYQTGGRIDLDWSGAGLSARYGESDGDTWKGRLRVEGLLCRSLSGLTYLEGGRKTERWSAYLRGTLFIVDNWDDRIYSYERDAPGNFTVPAYYGRGYALSAVSGYKPRLGKKSGRILKVWFRASMVDYPFMDEPKPRRVEVKLQANLSL